MGRLQITVVSFGNKITRYANHSISPVCRWAVKLIKIHSRRALYFQQGGVISTGRSYFCWAELFQLGGVISAWRSYFNWAELFQRLKFLYKALLKNIY